jgi:hypothetical protein
MIKFQFFLQNFKFYPKTNQLFNSFSTACLEMTSDFKLVMNACDTEAEGQKWNLTNYNDNQIVKKH